MLKDLLIAAYLTSLFISLPLSAQVAFDLVSAQNVQNRLDMYKGNDKTREAALFKIFGDAGCPAANLSEQPVPKRQEPNVICALPGDTAEEIIVGAHFDHVSEGDGVVDNWSGASLLPSLFQSLLASRHKHTFLFIGFTGEETGLLGSTFYVRHLAKSEIKQISLMLAIDSIGLGPTKVWASHSDKHAVEILARAAHVMKLPLAEVDMNGAGVSDEEPFMQEGVKAVTIHSLTYWNFRVLHSRLDVSTAISFHDYYETYRLLAAYLALLDRNLE